MDPGVGPPEFAPITIDLAVIEPEDRVAWKSGGRQSPRMQYMQPVSLPRPSKSWESQASIKKISCPSQSLDWRRRACWECPRSGEASKKEHDDALIEVHLIEKVFNPEQKRQIIQKLTDAMVSIEGENMRGVTWVKISEVTSGEWGIGGKPLTTEAVKELAAGRHAA